MSMSAVTQSRLAEIRTRMQSIGSSPAEQEEAKTLLHEAIELMRGDRTSASHASDTARRKSAKAAIPSAQDLLSELGL